MNDLLKNALTQLDQELTKRDLDTNIVICGAYAIYLLGYSRSEHTLDIDSIIELSSSEVKHLIKDIGRKLSLGPHWLNDQASTVSLPAGILARATPLTHWKSINASVICRTDLIKMKASAFSIRRDQTTKDWEDLVLLEPTNHEISEAIAFIKENNSPPSNANKKIFADFEETLRDLKKIAK